MIQLSARARVFAIPLFVAAAVACGGGGSDDPTSSSAEAVTTSCAVTPDVHRSLFVTDATALAGFTLQGVMHQIVATGSTSGQTGLALYQQMMDTMNTKAGGATTGPHCDDVKNASGQPTMNGFPVQLCPRQEGALAKTNPFTNVGTNPDSYVPLGLVNRFDLAPKNGANCGQYRVVFGKVSGTTNFADRMLLIFEAVLPNPQATAANPTPGLAGCVPVAKFWDDLTTDASDTDRAAKLKSFYFTGLSGFEPVIAAAHYGIGRTANTGQIRANMFMNRVSGQEWELREFRLSRPCTSTSCSLVAHNTFVQNNPFGPLFAGTDSASTTYQNAFLNQVPALAARTVPNIHMSTAGIDDGPESDEQLPTKNDYFAEAQGNSAFLANVTNKLASIGRTDLTAQNILDRASTQGCAGCHELSNGRSLGAGLVWPQSNGFTQIDERGALSPALVNVFLPARATTLVNFLNANCGDGGAPAAATADDPTTIGGSVVGASN